MKNVLGVMLLALLSNNVYSAEPINCSEPTEHAKMYSGSVSKMKFGERIDFKSLLKNMLLIHASEIERVVNLTPEYTGPDEEYIPRLIDLLDAPTGGKYEATCMWSQFKEGDFVQEFEENDATVFRKGYGLFRNSVLIAYFYSQIAVE